MRTQDQACHIPTDMLKALSTAKHLTLGSQTTADRLRDTPKRHHGRHPASGEGLCLAWARTGLWQPRPGVATRVDACPSSGRYQEGLPNIFILHKFFHVISWSCRDLTTPHGGIHHDGSPAIHQASPRGESAAVEDRPHTTEKSRASERTALHHCQPPYPARPVGGVGSLYRPA